MYPTLLADTVRRRRGGVSYLLRDEFTTAIAAGSLNGSLCDPTAQGIARYVNDTKMSTSSGWLRFVPQAALFNIGLWIDYPLTRAAGLILSIKFRPTVANGSVIGFDTNKATAPAHGFQWISPGRLAAWRMATVICGGYTDGEEYDLIVALRASGQHLLIRGGTEYPDWTLIWSDQAGTSSPIYVSVVKSANTQGSIDYIRIPETPWLPIPLASDGFGSAFGSTDGLGHPEGVTTGIGEGGDGKTLTPVGTWANAAGVSACSALAGGVGIATVDAGTTEVNLEITATVSGGVAGAVVRYVDSDNYLLAIHDGTNVILRKRVAGTETDVATVAVAVGALVVHADGALCRVFVGGVSKISEAITDAGLLTGTKHGIYTTDVGNTFNNLVIWGRS